MGRPSFRDTIITSGADTVHRRGFASTGIREITAAAGVAQGSFTNHFTSKDDFGIAVLDHYFARLRGVMSTTLADETRPPIKRLRAYFDTIVERFEEVEWRFGCLAGNMALEAVERSESIRQRMVNVFAEWTPHFAAVIRQGQRMGDIRDDIDAEELGAALFEAWQGAMLRMKIDRTPMALDRFKRLTFPALLGKAAW